MTKVETAQAGSAVSRWLSRPTSGWACVAGWGIATVIFLGFVAALGGPASNDTYESVFSTWAIQHGQLSCAFPNGFQVVPPVYPLLSGGVAALLHIGNSVPFPSVGGTSNGHCLSAFLAIDSWSRHSQAIGSTIKIGYLSWLVLMAGVISLTRAAGRGLRRWEPAAVITVAALPPVWMSVANTFHPEYLVALGLVLATVACAIRDRWIAAWVLIALAVLAQQFAVLVAVPLFILAPPRRRTDFGGAGLIAGLVIALPLLVLSHGEAAKAIAIGTGEAPGTGGTLLAELHLHGLAFLLACRVAPVCIAGLVAIWAARCLGRDAIDPIALSSIVAISLGLRLVLEQRLFAYYFMAFAVALVCLEIVTRRVRGWVVAWLIMVSLVYLAGAPSQHTLKPVWLHITEQWLPVAVMTVVLIVSLAIFVEDRLNSRIAAWVALLAVALAAWRVSDPYHHQPAIWVWQLVLVSIGVILAVDPLLERRALVRSTREPPGPYFVRLLPPAKIQLESLSASGRPVTVRRPMALGSARSSIRN